LQVANAETGLLEFKPEQSGVTVLYYCLLMLQLRRRSLVTEKSMNLINATVLVPFAELPRFWDRVKKLVRTHFSHAVTAVHLPPLRAVRRALPRQGVRTAGWLGAAE